MSNRFALLACALAVALAALPSQLSAADAVVGPPGVAWKKMTFNQKKAFMKASVVPTMKPLFQAFDAEKFRIFDCASCHGQDGAERKFKMPGKDTAPLPGTPEAFQAKLKTEPRWPEWAKFMSEKVEPAMGKLMDMPVFDPRKPDKNALSCAACHKIEKP